MQRQLTALFLVVLCGFQLFSVALTASVHKRRTLREVATDSSASRTCYNSTPCGWMVYVPFTRLNDYFLKNTCDCPKGKTCKQSQDDLSVSAYIYRCMVSDESSSQATTES